MPAGPRFEEVWSDLTTIFELGSQLRFVLVACEDGNTRWTLNRRLHDHCVSHLMEFRTPDLVRARDILAWLSEQQQTGSTPQMVRFIPVPDGEDETFLLHRLNENRDNLRRDLNGTLVL